MPTKGKTAEFWEDDLKFKLGNVTGLVYKDNLQQFLENLHKVDSLGCADEIHQFKLLLLDIYPDDKPAGELKVYIKILDALWSFTEDMTITPTMLLEK